MDSISRSTASKGLMEMVFVLWIPMVNSLPTPSAETGLIGSSITARRHNRTLLIIVFRLINSIISCNSPCILFSRTFRQIVRNQFFMIRAVQRIGQPAGHFSLPGVISADHTVRITVEQAAEITEVPASEADILCRILHHIKGIIIHMQFTGNPFSRSRHKLHEAHCADRRFNGGSERAFVADHSRNQRG